jgi:hypothetical protein
VEIKDEQVFVDYLEFHNNQMLSKDIDPVYPVLKYTLDSLNLNIEQKMWCILLYVAYYQIGSGFKAFEEYPFIEVPDTCLSLPCETERRNHRVPERLAKHFESIVDVAYWNGSLFSYFSKGFTFNRRENWLLLNERLMKFWGNGRWAGYKTAEIFMKVLDFDVEPTDMGHNGASGSRRGLEILFNNVPSGNSSNDIKELDLLSNELVLTMNDRGYHATIETAETSLCDFNSKLKGRYYTGIDIDKMQTALKEVPSKYTDLLFEARKETLPHQFLGELNNWDGVRKDVKLRS